MDVTIVCGRDALKLLERAYVGSVFLPGKKPWGEFWVLEWQNVCWSAEFAVVSKIEEVLSQLESVSTRNRKLAYKRFILGSGKNDIRIKSNVMGFELFSDFCVQRAVIIPETSPVVKKGYEPAGGLQYNHYTDNLMEITLTYAGLVVEYPELTKMDSTVWKQEFVDWANEFETICPLPEYWEIKDYLDCISDFARKKIFEFAGVDLQQDVVTSEH